MFTLPFGRGRGLPRPYRAVYFYCPVGRGDLTPPCKLGIAANFPLIRHRSPENWNCLLFLLYNETNNEQKNCRNYQKQSIY